VTSGSTEEPHLRDIIFSEKLNTSLLLDKKLWYGQEG